MVELVTRKFCFNSLSDYLLAIPLKSEGLLGGGALMHHTQMILSGAIIQYFGLDSTFTFSPSFGVPSGGTSLSTNTFGSD